MAEQDWQDMIEDAVKAKYWADYAEQGVTPSDFKGWKWACDLSGVTFTAGPVTYGPVNPTLEPMVLAYQEWTNDSAAKDVETLSVNKSTTASFSWTVTETLKIKSSQKISCGLPGIAGGSIDLSEELDVGSAQTTTTTQAQSWTETYEVNVPAHSTVAAQVSIQVASYTTPFQVTYSFSGTVTAGMVQGSESAENTYDVADVLPPDQLTQTASGTFSGVEGINSSVYTGPPLQNGAEVAAPAGADVVQ